MNSDDTKLKDFRESKTLSFLRKANLQSRENTSFIVPDKSNELENILANRRFKAEDPNFNPDQVPALKELALRQIIDNFSFNCSTIQCLNKDQLQHVLEVLPTTIPLRVAATTISDGPFWKRMALSRWQAVDIARHGNSWKRAFFEKYVAQSIEEFIPGDDFPNSVEETLEYAAPYISSIKIREMRPPKRCSVSKSKESPDDDSSVPLDDHLDLGPVIDKMDKLTQLSVQYRVNSVGLDFEWDDNLFTGQDCISFSKAVGYRNLLAVLELTNSRVDCSKCQVLVHHLLDHPSLTVLNLSHNVISDLGAQALSKLISGRSRLECLDLTDNQLGEKSGAALGVALENENCTITKLNLRLNRIKDPGAILIAKALQQNATLRELNLAANGIGEATFNAFGEALSYNSVLQKFDLSNNSISVEAGKRFQEYLSCNRSLIYLDVRLTGISQDYVLLLQKNVEKNLQNLQKHGDNVATNYISLSGLTSVAMNEQKLALETDSSKALLFDA